MTNSGSLLSHLAWKLTNQTETLATEALGYILSQSDAARRALQELVSAGGANVGAIKEVKTEAVLSKNERVDLACFDAGGAKRVLIEAKFWAGLTGNQPAAYLKHLPRDGKPAVLLFVAPEQRQESLWPEVLRNAEVGFDCEETAGAKIAIVDNSERRLMLTSWRRLLDAMLNSNDIKSSTKEDISQLNALCERMDTEAFLPLHESEFAPAFPRRMINLERLISDARIRANEKGCAEYRGRLVTPQTYGYGCYMKLGVPKHAEVWLGVNYHLWVRHRETPLWLMFSSSFNDNMSEIRRKLGEWMMKDTDSIPISLPIGVEYEEVLDAVVNQLCEIACCLNAGDPIPRPDALPNGRASANQHDIARAGEAEHG